MSSKPIKLTDNQIAIMGKPNFACARFAQVLIKSGMYVEGPSKAEYEQAVYIHFALALLDEHGDAWTHHAATAITDALHALLATPDDEG